jgi:hypothetical protein
MFIIILEGMPQNDSKMIHPQHVDHDLLEAGYKNDS